MELNFSFNKKKPFIIYKSSPLLNKVLITKLEVWRKLWLISYVL